MSQACGTFAPILAFANPPISVLTRQAAPDPGGERINPPDKEISMSIVGIVLVVLVLLLVFGGLGSRL